MNKYALPWSMEKEPIGGKFEIWSAETKCIALGLPSSVANRIVKCVNQRRDILAHAAAVQARSAGLADLIERLLSAYDATVAAKPGTTKAERASVRMKKAIDEARGVLNARNDEQSSDERPDTEADQCAACVSKAGED